MYVVTINIASIWNLKCVLFVFLLLIIYNFRSVLQDSQERKKQKLSGLSYQFERLYDNLTEAQVKVNMTDVSYKRCIEMLNQGDLFILDGPITEGRKVFWLVQSQNCKNLSYNVSITPNMLSTYRNKRETFKNFTYKCSCEAFKVKICVHWTCLRKGKVSGKHFI